MFSSLYILVSIDLLQLLQVFYFIYFLNISFNTILASSHLISVLLFLFLFSFRVFCRYKNRKNNMYLLFLFCINGSAFSSSPAKSRNYEISVLSQCKVYNK